MNQVPWLRLTAFVLTALLSGTIVVNTITDQTGGSTRQYRASFSNAQGLLPGNEVMIAGVRVGKVSDVSLERGLALVTFEVSTDQQIPRGSVAAVRYADMLGGRFLALTPGSGGPPLREDEEIPLAQTRPPLDLTALLNGFKPLFDAIDPNQVNQLASEIVTVFDGEHATITDLLTKVVAVTSNLADQDAVIGQVVTNLNSVLGMLNQNQAQMRGLISGLSQLTAAAAHNAPQIADTVDNGAALAESLNGMLRDVGPGLTHDVRSMREIADTLVRNQQKFGDTLHQMPLFLNALNRAGDYGSWVNVYVCNLSVNVAGKPLSLGIGPHSEVCR